MTVPEIALSAPVGPEGAPLLVLGCSLGTSSILWENAMPELATRYRTVVWDLPGHGRSPRPTESFRVAELADAVAERVREAGASRIHYAGVSLGGAVGLALALRHPDLVDALAVVASGARLGEPSAWQARAADVRARSTSVLVAASAERWFAPGSLEREPDLGGRLLRSLQAADDEGYARCCEALADFDVRAELPAITAPVLALWGRGDRVAPEALAREVATGVGNGRIAVVEDAAHLPPAEQPARTAAELLRFFADVTPGGAP